VDRNGRIHYGKTLSLPPDSGENSARLHGTEDPKTEEIAIQLFGGQYTISSHSFAIRAASSDASTTSSQVSVWGEQAASVPSAVVRPDGKISMPLLKEVAISGLTPTQAGKPLPSNWTNTSKAPMSPWWFPKSIARRSTC
jgi:hypothetical protein